MEYIHRMSGARGEDAKKLLQDWIVNVLSKSCKYVVSGEVALKQTQKDDPPINPRERAGKGTFHLLTQMTSWMSPSNILAFPSSHQLN